jgi:hypothetical protein
MSALGVIVMDMIAHGLGLTNGLLVVVELPAWLYWQETYWFSPSTEENSGIRWTALMAG